MTSHHTSSTVIPTSAVTRNPSQGPYPGSKGLIGESLLPIYLLMRVPLPEQIWIDIEPASFGSRALAYMVDFSLRWCALLLLLLLTFFLLHGLGFGSSLEGVLTFLRSISGGPRAVLLALIILAVFAVQWSYPIYFEVRRDGVSPGKALVGLRVVDEQGLPITFRTSCLRTVMTLVDLMPALGLTAFVSMSSNKKSQRLGDLLARTMVVYSPRKGEGAEEFRAERTHTADLTLPLELFNIVEKYLVRREQLSPGPRAETLQAILQAFRDLCKSIEVPKLAGLEAQEQWLMRIYQRSKPAKQGESRARKDSEIHWRSVQQELSACERLLARLEDQSAPLNIAAIQSTAQAYQQVCQRYAYLATFYPNTAAAKRAARLVRYGRRLVYGKRLSVLSQSAAPPFLRRVTQSFTAVRGSCGIAALLAGLAGVLAAAVIGANPALSWHFLDEATVQSLRAGRIWTEQVQGMSSLASSFIMTNNIKVTLGAYALGITGGVGTVLVMIFNGAHIGGIFAALSLYDMSYPLLDFIAAHGFLELSVIAVAGGCGIHIGDALLAPGPLSRKDALQQHARDTIDLVLFNIPCLVVAGLVEGFVSPYPWIPFPVKLGVGLGLGAAYWLLLTGRIAKGAK